MTMGNATWEPRVVIWLAALVAIIAVAGSTAASTGASPTPAQPQAKKQPNPAFGLDCESTTLPPRYIEFSPRRGFYTTRTEGFGQQGSKEKRGIYRAVRLSDPLGGKFRFRFLTGPLKGWYGTATVYPGIAAFGNFIKDNRELGCYS